MGTQVLSVVALVGAGLTAGVLFAVALSVVPGLWAMPPDRYVYVHQRITNWDPTMPVVVLLSATVAAVLAVLRWPTGAAWLFGGAAALLVGVAVVSHFANVPLNRQVDSLDPEQLPADWQDPRPLWRRWHLLRTVLAITALTLVAIAIAIT